MTKSIKDAKDQLETFFNEQFAWGNEYYENNDDAIDGYEHILFETIDFCKFKALAQRDDISNEEILNYCNSHALIKRASQSYPDNALTFVNIHEIEIQISGTSGTVFGKDVGCVFTELTKDMGEDEVERCFDKSKASDDCTLSDDCLYYRPDFSSIQLIVEEEHVLQEFKRCSKGA